MPELRVPKREAFARLIAEGTPPQDAYIQAGYRGGYTGAQSHSYVLRDKPEVRARIEELKAGARRRHEVTMDSLTDEYEQARKLAMDIESPGAAVSATTGKAKLHGLDKSDQTVIGNRTVNIGDVELARRMTMLLQRGVDALDAG
jgi:phage terminase small subunit